MPALRVAAVQAAYVLMDRDATIDRVAALTAAAAADGAQLVVFPEVFVPGTPIWIDTQPIWDGDEDWFGLLAANSVVIGGPASEREETLVVDLDLRDVAIERRHMDPVGHFHRPDVFRLHTDTSPRPAVVETHGNVGAAGDGAAGQQMINEP
jgi:predicted amidohydrolase